MSKQITRQPSVQLKYRQGMIAHQQPFAKKHQHRKLSESMIILRPEKLTGSSQQLVMTKKIYEMMMNYTPKDIPTIQKNIVKHIQYTLARTRLDFKVNHCYQAVSHSVKDRIIQYFNDTHREFHRQEVKQVNYLSLQFLLGRCLQNSAVNIDVSQQYRTALRQLGVNWEQILDQQIDPALGNGGLGRLAACFLDSLATLNYPGWGYGIRYDYGIFKQKIQNGHQIQVPDFWLSHGNPWQIERFDVQYKIKFYGRVKKYYSTNNEQKSYWQNTEIVIARAYDIPIPGYATFNTLGLRLWKSFPTNEFNFQSFSKGSYFEAIGQKQNAQYITSVLYPNDHNRNGKELRLKQQYLLVSASLQDIIRRNKRKSYREGKEYDWKTFPIKASIQLNDTHPALAIVELLRILVDQQSFSYQFAWEIVTSTFSYTNHTVLPQALQKWDVQILGKLLPRHLDLIYYINLRWLKIIQTKFANDIQKIRNLSLVEQSFPKSIRMANLSIIGSHTVNGVSQVHSELLKKSLFKDFVDVFPDKFINITNGITVRRWIICCNPLLADLYCDQLDSDFWVLDMSLLKKLQPLSDNINFQNKWRAIKLQNKNKLAHLIKRECNIKIDVSSLFDVQVKRIHEYKRQFMNILYVIWRYLWIKRIDPKERIKIIPRTVIFAGKAAPGYEKAKTIIKLINEVSYVVNSDKQTKDFLKVVFLPNYNVSNAQIIIPATELSQHISTAGTQASGTSNMKFILNGSLIIGTMDGANIEIYNQVGQQNIFIFGAKITEVQKLRKKMYQSSSDRYIPQSLKIVFEAIQNGLFGQKHILMSLINSISNNNDYYLICADFDDYIATQEKIDQTYRNQQKWTKMSILNALRAGKFSSDRTIKQYAQKIWKIKPYKIAKIYDNLSSLPQTINL